MDRDLNCGSSAGARAQAGPPQRPNGNAGPQRDIWHISQTIVSLSMLMSLRQYHLTLLSTVMMSV